MELMLKASQNSFYLLSLWFFSILHGVFREQGSMHNQWHRYPGKTLVSFLSLTLMIGCCDWWCLCYGLYWAHCSFLAQLIKNTTPRRTQMNKVLRDIRECVFKVNVCRCMCLCVSETHTILEPLRDYWKRIKLTATLLWVPFLSYLGQEKWD